MANFCTKCGMQNDDDSRFCYRCGAELNPVKPDTSPVESVTEPTEPVAEPFEHLTEPVEPATDPFVPITEPVKPATEPVNPYMDSFEPIRKFEESERTVEMPRPEPFVKDTVFCEYCGAKIAADSKFCTVCGARFASVGNEEFSFAGADGKPKKKKSKAFLIPIILLLVLLIAAGSVFAVAYFTDVHIPFVSALVKKEETTTAAPKKEDKTEEDKENSSGWTPAEPESVKATVEVESTTEASAPIVLIKGNVIQYGSYPQSRVTDSATVAALNDLSDDMIWSSYGYASGNGKKGSMVTGDWMQYIDVTYNGEKYRGVYFTQYRPFRSYLESNAENSQQDDNGYSTNVYYWFRYEPLSWIVLDAENGLLLCQKAIDAQPHTQDIYESGSELYNNSGCTTYACDYTTSYLRTWLNSSFLNTAFSFDERENIVSHSWDNSSATTAFSKYSSSSTNDYIATLSYSEAQNAAYGFNADSARQSVVTDYAKCQGVYLSDSGVNSNSHLRSPGCGSGFAAGINSGGSIYEDGLVESTRVGVRPIMYVSFD